MPKNKGKGGKNRRRGKNEAENDKRELVFKEHGQEYAQVRFGQWGQGGQKEGTDPGGLARGGLHVLQLVWIALGRVF